MINAKKISTLLPLVFACNLALAQDDEPALEEVTITASKTERPLREVGSSVTVLTAEELKKINRITLADVLRTVPAVGVSESGGLGKAASVRIRGEEGYRTLLLIDGINVTDLSGPQSFPRFEHVLNSQLGRVEVLRGPQGLIYGADAGGVVSIFSKTTDRPFEADLSLETGEYNTHSVGGNVRGRQGRGHYSLTASGIESDGFNARDADTAEEEDGYNNTTVHLNTGFAVSDEASVGLVLRNIDADTEYDDCFNSTGVSHACEAEFSQFSGRVNGVYQTEKHRHEIAYSKTETKNFDRELTENVLVGDNEGEIEQWQYFGNYQIAPILNMEFGVDNKRETYTDFLYGNDGDRNQMGAYLEGQVEVTDNFFYSIGARYDDNDDFGEHTSYRLSTAYLVPVQLGEIKFKGGYSTGFRAPSLYEEAYNAGPYANPALVPPELEEETSEGYEAGIEWLMDSHRLELVFFHSRIEDLIFFDMTSFAGYLQATGTTESEGVELSGRVNLLDAMTLGTSYTYNKTELDETTGMSGQRPRRPKHLYNVSIEYQLWQDRVSLAALYRGARDMIENASTVIEDYDVLDVNASWRVRGNAEIYLRMVNALDEEYQEVPTYNTSGSAAYIGARFHF